MQKGTEIGQFQKNRREIVKGVFTEFNGHSLFDLRVYAIGKDGKETPTRKGICTNVDFTGPLLELIKKAHMSKGKEEKPKEEEDGVV